MAPSPAETPQGVEKRYGALPGAVVPAVMRAGINPDLEGADLHEALYRAIALRRSSCTWREVAGGWVVTVSLPELRRFFGSTLEEALAWCLWWVMAAQTPRQD